MKSFARMTAAMRERLRGTFLRGKADAELEEELRFHIEQERARLLALGIPEAEASRRAAAAFGGVERVKDEVRDARGLAWLPGMKLDFALGIRMMKKHPALSLVGGFGMSLGIALAVGAFVFQRAQIFATLPLDEGHRIIALENRDTVTKYEERQLIHDFVVWRQELKSVEHVGAFRQITKNLMIGEAPPEPVELAEMSAAGFRVARVAPLMGRYLIDDDEREGATPVLVIGYDQWQRRFFGKPDVVGQQVRLGGVMHAIVGVMPEDFAFPQRHSMWVPLKPNPLAFPRRNGYAYYVFGRLAPGATMESAQAELTALGRQVGEQHPENKALAPTVVPYIESLTGMSGDPWYAAQMQLMMTLLLIVVALNVAMLVYARTATRQGEIAVRTAVGASRTRIVSQLFIEALTLSGTSAIVGMVIAMIGIKIAQRSFEQQAPAFWVKYELEPVTVIFTMGLAIFAAVIVGVMPALQATGKRLQLSLRAMSGTGMRLGGTWTTLVVLQVAIAVAVIPPAFGFAWEELSRGLTTTKFEPVQYGMATLESDGTDAMGVMIPRTGAFGDRLRELIRQVEAEPNVAGASYLAHASGAPKVYLEAEGVAAPLGSHGHWGKSSGVGLDYLSLYGARMIAGRAFEPADLDTAATAVIVNRAFMDGVMAGVNPVGRRVRFAGMPANSPWGLVPPSRWFRVVGVVENLEQNEYNAKLIQPEIYYGVSPEQAHLAQSVEIVTRARSGSAAVLAPRLRQIAVQVDPTFRLNAVRTHEDLTREAKMVTRLMSIAMGVVLISVLLLSAAGIYALVSFTVTRRWKEIGIRTALGAGQAQVLRDVLGRVGRQIAGGVVLGLIGAVVIDRLGGGTALAGKLGLLLPFFGIVMTTVALLAAFGPARRAMRIQPTEALRADA